MFCDVVRCTQNRVFGMGAGGIWSVTPGRKRPLQRHIFSRPSVRVHLDTVLGWLPLLPPREERAGERRAFRLGEAAPLPGPLPTRSSRGEGVGSIGFKNSVQMHPIGTGGIQMTKSSALIGSCFSVRARSQSSARVTRSTTFTTASRASFITERIAQRASSGQEHFS